MATRRSAGRGPGGRLISGSFKRAFAPVVDAQTRLLVLGSLPGDASLMAGRYYAHPRNAFWRLIGRVVGQDLVAIPYPERLEVLKAAGIGLWDVIARGERQGSLDAAIRNAEAADLPAMVATLPALHAIAFNGTLSAHTGRRSLGAQPPWTLIDLPSSSPAHARPFAEKAAVWDQLAITLR